MDDSSFCQQKPYSCTAHFLPHFNMVGGVNKVPIVNTCIYYIVHGKYGPTSFITQHALYSALRVQCVWFTLRLR